MDDDFLDQLEAGLVRIQSGVCVASDLEVAAADAISKLRSERDTLRAELAAERERAEQWKLISKSEAEDSDAFEAERDALRECLGFFASVIKSGEGWTETCQRKYDAALKGDGDD